MSNPGQGVFSDTSPSMPGSVNITNISTEIIPLNLSRRWCYVSNIGNKDVYMSFGNLAIAKKGIFLKKKGGSLLMGFDTVPIDALNGITKSGLSIVTFQWGII